MTSTESVTFGVFPDEGDVSAVMNDERPDMPDGILASIQDAVDGAVDAGRLEVDEAIPELGKAIYEPGGDVRGVTLDESRLEGDEDGPRRLDNPHWQERMGGLR